MDLARSIPGGSASVALLLILIAATPQLVAADEGGHGLRPLHSALQKTVAGRCLLESVAGQGDRQGFVGLDILVGQLEVVIGMHSGLIIDGTDVALVEAAAELRKMPRRLREEPTAVVMVLLDEWIRRLADAARAPRLLEALRHANPPKNRARTCVWLETYFPVWFRYACSVMTNAAGRCHTP